MLHRSFRSAILACSFDRSITLPNSSASTTTPMTMAIVEKTYIGQVDTCSMTLWLLVRWPGGLLERTVLTLSGWPRRCYLRLESDKQPRGLLRNRCRLARGLRAGPEALGRARSRGCGVTYSLLLLDWSLVGDGDLRPETGLALYLRVVKVQILSVARGLPAKSLTPPLPPLTVAVYFVREERWLVVDVP